MATPSGYDEGLIQIIEAALKCRDTAAYEAMIRPAGPVPPRVRSLVPIPLEKLFTFKQIPSRVHEEDVTGAGLPDLPKTSEALLEQLNAAADRADSCGTLEAHLDYAHLFSAERERLDNELWEKMFGFDILAVTRDIARGG